MIPVQKEFWDCSICLEPLSKDVVTSNRCHHSYHHICMDKWLKEQDTCPVCKIDQLGTSLLSQNDVLPEEYQKWKDNPETYEWVGEDQVRPPHLRSSGWGRALTYEEADTFNQHCHQEFLENRRAIAAGDQTAQTHKERYSQKNLRAMGEFLPFLKKDQTQIRRDQIRRSKQLAANAAQLAANAAQLDQIHADQISMKTQVASHAAQLESNGAELLQLKTRMALARAEHERFSKEIDLSRDAWYERQAKLMTDLGSAFFKMHQTRESVRSLIEQKKKRTGGMQAKEVAIIIAYTALIILGIRQSVRDVLHV